MTKFVFLINHSIATCISVLVGFFPRNVEDHSSHTQGRLEGLVGIETGLTLRTNLQPMADGRGGNFWHRYSHAFMAERGLSLRAMFHSTSSGVSFSRSTGHNVPLIITLLQYIHTHIPMPLFPKIFQKLQNTSIQVFISVSASGGNTNSGKDFSVFRNSDCWGRVTLAPTATPGKEGKKKKTVTAHEMKVQVPVAQSCPALRDPVECSTRLLCPRSSSRQEHALKWFQNILMSLLV